MIGQYNKLSILIMIMSQLCVFVKTRIGNKQSKWSWFFWQNTHNALVNNYHLDFTNFMSFSDFLHVCQLTKIPMSVADLHNKIFVQFSAK